MILMGVVLAPDDSYGCGASNNIRGLFAGRNGSALVEKITIASTGNGATFGDLSVTRNNLSGNSNGHGGLS